VLAELLHRYLHELRDVFGVRPGADGRFRYERLPLHLAGGDRAALLVRADGALAGFALVARGSVVDGAPDVRDLSEFFVVPEVRRRGVGGRAASAVFAAFPGRWEVRAYERNPGAVEFWSRAVAAHTAGTFARLAWTAPSHRRFTVFRFVQP
jgi:predicted acetyltransferase